MFSREAAISTAVRKSGSEPGCVGPVIERFYEAVKFQTNHLLTAPQVIQPFLYQDVSLFHRIKTNFLQVWREYVDEFQDSHKLYRQSIYDVSNAREIEIRCSIATLEFFGGLLLQPSRLKRTQGPSNPKYSNLDFSFLCPCCREVIENVTFDQDLCTFQFSFTPNFTL